MNQEEAGSNPGATVFEATRWSVVLAAGDGASPHAAAALEKLCSAYWYTLYAYVRRRGYSTHDAQDLTQSFFAQLLRRDGLRGVAPGLGKFRSFLLAALQNFLADEWDRQRAQKRGGGQLPISLDAQEAEERYQFEPVDGATPEKLFDRRWAMILLDGALDRLEREFVADGKGLLFQQLRGWIVEDARGRPCAEIAQDLGMTEEAVKKTVQRLRRRYRQVIREEIAHTVSAPGDIEGELRCLVSSLGS